MGTGSVESGARNRQMTLPTVPVPFFGRTIADDGDCCGVRRDVSRQKARSRAREKARMSAVEKGDGHLASPFSAGLKSFRLGASPHFPLPVCGLKTKKNRTDARKTRQPERR